MLKNNEIKIYSQEDFSQMRKAGKIAASILDYITPYVVPGVTTLSLNNLCHDEIIKKECIPAPLNYKGYPFSTCISVNHVVCHGFPSEKILKEGDIVNIDVTVIKDGWYGDTSRTYCVGNKIPLKASKLVRVTYEAMMLGIEQVKPEQNINEIGRAIQNHAEKNGFSVVRDFCGHGIGDIFHSTPNVLHYYDKNYSIILKPGMIFTIEPMINAGDWRTTLLSDGWTAITKDRSLSAQFEHTIGVTDDGFEIFTLV